MNFILLFPREFIIPMSSDRPKLVSTDISADMSAEMSVSVSVVPAETDITMHYLTQGFGTFCLFFIV